MMKLTKKLFIASLSVAMVCSLFAGAFSFNGNSVKADESPAGAITYKLSEELSKITYTAEELTAFNAAHYPNGDGWTGTYGAGDVDAKAAFLKTVFEKSAIEVYSGYNSAYTAKHYYEWAGDGNSWRYSYVAVNGVGAGNWNGGLASNLNGTANNMGVYAGTNGLAWGLAVVAPEDGTITIPASTMSVIKFLAGADYVATGNETLKVGFSKSATALTTLKPTDASLNMQGYGVGDHAIAEQKFEVAKGERVYITLYTDMGSLVSDGRAIITWDPSFVFEKEVEEVNSITYKISKELSKVGYTDEELAASGWNGTSRDANKQALFKTAYEKSAFEVYSAYGASSPAYNAKYYYDWADDGNSYRFSYTQVAGLSVGNNGTTQERIDKDGTHTIYAGTNGLAWALALVAPAKGTITIPEHVLNVKTLAYGAQALAIGFSKTSTQYATINPADEQLNMVRYNATGNYTIAEQVFEVEAGDRIYVVLFADTLGSFVSDSRSAIAWDPDFIFDKYVEPAGQQTVSLNSEVAKITLTEAELAAAGWDGVTSRTPEKEAALRTAFGKSAIKFYTASGYTGQNYAQKEYYTWANSSNDWLMSYTKVNELGAGYAVPNSSNPRFTSNGTHMLFSRDATYHIVWALGYVAPEDGVVTIPAHELILNYFTNTDGLYIGFSKGSADRATINPNDASLNFVKYTTTGTAADPENKVISFDEQKFAVSKGEVVYINIYCNPTGSDARASVTWNPTFSFVAGEEIEVPEEPEEEGVIKVTLADEIGKIVITDEDKAATGYDGSLAASEAKEAAFKLAFAKSALTFYAASNSAVDYRQMQYWDYAKDGNAWTMNYSAVNTLTAGTQSYNPSQNLRWEATGTHSIYSRSIKYHITWAIGFTAPEKGTITIPEHTLVITSFTNASALQLGFSKDSASRSKIKPGDASLNCVEYTQAGTYVIPEQTFTVNKGEVVYLNVYVDATGDDARASVSYNPTFIFRTDACVLNGHTEVVDSAVAPTCTATGLTEGKHCSVCNEVIVAQTVVNALGHDKVVSKTGYAATCTEDGLTDEFTCSVCGESFAQTVIPALGHSLTSHKAQAPTCTEIGWDAYEDCSACDYSTYVEKAATGHDMAPATCTAPATCKNGCGHTEGEANGHSLTSHKAQAPTCTEIGWDAYEDCSACDYSTYVEKAATGHDMAEANCVAPKTCKNGCGHTEGEALGHIEVVDKAVEPDCENTGLTEGKHCARCEEVLVAQEVVDALGHDMADATCLLPATCSVCGHTEGGALGHAWAPATCTAPSTCETCGETKGEALGHDMAPATCTAPATCVNGCGHTEGEPIDHTYGDWEIVKVPTHLEEGLQQKTCQCGDAIYETLPINEDYDVKSFANCAGSLSGSSLGLLLAAISGAVIIRKKRR